MSRFLNWVDLRAFLRDSTTILFVTKILNYGGWNQNLKLFLNGHDDANELQPVDKNS